MTADLAGLLGPGAHYSGSLSFQGRVRIDGTFEGTIRSDDLLEIGPDGRVEGEIEVAQALIAGFFDGTITARERCTVLETAEVRGRIVTPYVDVRTGATLRCEMNVTRK